MKAFDQYLQRRRIDRIRPYIKEGIRVLDIGCGGGELFNQIPAITDGIGLDPDMECDRKQGGVTLVKGMFPKDLPDKRPFDVITMMAVLEHIPEPQQLLLAADCAQHLVPGGLVLITVPSAWVDPIIEVLLFLHIMDGTVGRSRSVDQHYGFDANKTPRIFVPCGLELVKAQKFQLGLNNFFAFRKPGK